MNISSFSSSSLWFTCFHVVLFSSSLLCLHSKCAAGALGNDTDQLSLLKFKEAVEHDPFEVLASWNSSSHFCMWHGITCSLRHQRVTSLNLQGYALRGLIPPEIGRLFRLQQLYLTNNTLRGQIPTNLSSCYELKSLSLSGNKLVGKIPMELGFLTKLELLSIGINNLTGEIPASIGNLSSLGVLILGINNLEGKVPKEIGHLKNLTHISIAGNKLSGSIPASFGMFQKMQSLTLNVNKLSGEIPPSIGNLSQLFQLDLSNNMLEGSIPPSVGNCQYLQYLDLSHNTLSGTIPLQVFGFPSLSLLLNLSHNSLNGSLPIEVGNLKSVNKLDVSKNALSGEIPSTIGQCISVEFLNIHGNSFQGAIPSSLASLKGLQYLDLSQNNFSGSIPEGLESIPVLQYLNISFNRLDGEVPTKGVFRNASAISIKGNSDLCGGITKLHLPPCPVKVMTNRKHQVWKKIVIIISVVVFLLLLASFVAFYWKKNSNRRTSRAHKSFIAECNALRNIRHRNLVKILTCCSSMDYKGDEFKALVFDYMENGSLEKWLHSESEIGDQPTLNLLQRLNIIVEVGSALHYLHYECEQLIVHCDLKPNNILLDNEMVAHVSDFGLARLLCAINGVSRLQSSTIGIKGTVGYAPPEYGMGGEVSTLGDVYSFGILVLEMLTGRKPTNEMFINGINLHNFVKVSLPDKLLHIVDSALLPRELKQIEKENKSDQSMKKMLPNDVKKCLLELFSIGLACSAESPKERMNMRDVTRELHLIRNAFIGSNQFN
uniref:non-specific serine/threonine protein kinase n=1 Tax=Cajanus cajan TaxID=3821 RepID=A0A151QTX1_CAJCA|nr:LRR receptor-like serine/threonine-protein kinase EFR [Cajanus cajan]